MANSMQERPLTIFKHNPAQRQQLQGLVLAAATVILFAFSPAQAGNGDPADGQGAFRTEFCTGDYIELCDDQHNPGFPSCHQILERGGNVLDQGLATQLCRDGNIARGENLEADVAVTSTEFDSVVCGQENNGLNFCIVCQTYVREEGGSRGGGPPTPATETGVNSCVRIEQSTNLSSPGTCGAFNVTLDSEGQCDVELFQLQQSFADPSLGFLIQRTENLAGQPGSADVLVCNSPIMRSWECTDNPSDLLGDPVIQPAPARAQGPEQGGTINTPGCIKLKSGGWYC